MRLLLHSVLLIIGCMLFACNSGKLYNQHINIPNNTWNMKNIAEFKPEIQDTTSIFNIYIHIRNTGEYPMSNLFLFVKTTSPQGFYVKDTFECVLSDQKGKWLGKGFGSVWSNKVIFKKNVRFPYPGDYIFKIEQAMRINKLPGIVDVGMSIEKVKY